MDITSNLLTLATYKSRKIESTENTEAAHTQAPVGNTTIITATDETKLVPAESGINNAKQMLYSDIKAAIYNKSHPSVNGVTTSYGTTFDTICTTLGISPGSSITKADLTKLTRNDSLEDANNDFCGALNRAFSYLSPTDTISYNDLMLFFMRGAGSDGKLNFSEYKTVVNNYADIVQQQFEACTTPQQKLEFAIQKTKDYLTESRMDMQLNALTRLTTEPCASENIPDAGTRYPTYENAVNQIAHVGQIAFADLGDWQTVDANGNPDPNGGYRTITQGAYQSWIGSNSYTVNGANVNMWGGDDDGYYTVDGQKYWGDTGITLNSKYYIEGSSTKWYELVEVFVHELTHATAYYYYDATNWPSTFTQRGLDFMASKGFINSGAYSPSSTNTDLIYMVSTMWDEYAAYTTSCNYFDSIGGDVFDSGVDLAVNGTQEKTAIQNHLVSTGYGVRPTPDYKGWDWETFNNMFYFA